MGILFLILKIIGVLLAVCVLLLVLAAAVPVRYRVRAEFYEDAAGYAVFSWLFHILDFRVRYEEEFALRLRIFGIPIRLSKEEDAAANQEEEEEQEAADSPVEEQEPMETDELPMEEQEAADSSVEEQESMETDELPMEEQETADSSVGEQESMETDEPPLEKAGVLPLGMRIRKFFQGIRRWISDIISGAEAAKEKIQNIKNTISDETNKSAAAKVWREFRYLLRHLSPRKVSGELAFGTADPAQTGQILGILSMIPFWARYKVNVLADFEAERLYVQGRLQMRGHIRLWHFVLTAIRLLKDKEVRSAWRRLRT